MRIEDEKEILAENIRDVGHVVNGVETKAETTDFPLSILLIRKIGQNLHYANERHEG